MGNLVADAMREKYPGVEAAWTNSGGLRRPRVHAAPAGEQPCEITWGEMFAVLPFSNSHGHRDPHRCPGQDRRSSTGSPAFCNPLINTGRFPQVSGIKVQFHCNATTPPVIDGVWKAPNGPSGTLTPLGDADTLRFVTNDFMYTGGDGYTVFGQGTNVQQPGDDLLQVAIDYIAAHSPVSSSVQGRIVGP